MDPRTALETIVGLATTHLEGIPKSSSKAGAQRFFRFGRRSFLE